MAPAMANENAALDDATTLKYFFSRATDFAYVSIRHIDIQTHLSAINSITHLRFILITADPR